MQFKTFLSALFFFLFSVYSSAQKNVTHRKGDVTHIEDGHISAPLLKTTCDCKDAIKINIQKNTKYGLTAPPDGFGAVQEIVEHNKSDKYAFEKEHNSAWYLLNINFDGDFVFEIVPKDTANDYDFILYKYSDSSFCDDLLHHKIKPVRTNLSRCKAELKGYTGLSTSAKNQFVGKGIADAYSKSIEVKKGEKYMLILDNVYPEGSGHTIFFNYIKQVEISGTVLNADSVPMKKADVSLIDNKGKIITEVQTDDFGKYGFKSDLKESVSYNLSISSDSGFTQMKTINTNELKGKQSFTDIRTILPKLKKGTKYNMGSINFYGDQATLLPESYASVEALYNLMKKNKKMIIKIEGHVHGNPGKSSKFEQQLSEDRAKTVFDYLIKKGIDKTRMSTIGYGTLHLLFPRPNSPDEMAANRRVEINVISVN